MKSRFILMATVLLSLGGCVINMHLTQKHTSKASGPAWFSSICSPEDNPAFNCDVVLASKWAVFSIAKLSFVEPDPETGGQDGIPIALLGWFYFTSVAVWLTAIGRPTFSRRWWHLVPTLAVAAGCAVSAFYVYVLRTQLDVECAWCMASHGINFLLLVGTLCLWPRRPGAAKPSEAERPAEATASEHHPRGRLVAVTGVCAVSLMYAEFARAVADRRGHTVSMYQGQLAAIAKDTDTQIALFEGQKPVNIAIRGDDPRRGKGEKLLPLVVFSDFQCPACREFAKDLQRRIDPTFDNLLHITWKHYPLGKDCNRHVAGDIHPRACEAALAAEAARLQGGNEAFWRAHDFFFANPALFRNTIDWRKVGAMLELDADRFVVDMHSEVVKARVAEDIEQGKALGVNATPGIFLWGRQAQRYMLNNQLFLDRIKKAFIRVREASLQRRQQQEPKSEQEENGLPPSASDESAIEDNPDRPGAP